MTRQEACQKIEQILAQLQRDSGYNVTGISAHAYMYGHNDNESFATMYVSIDQDQPPAKITWGRK
jgi:hypothetical protein